VDPEVQRKKDQKMAEAVQDAAMFNIRLLMERQTRGPFYYEPHTRTYQVLHSYTIKTPTDQDVLPPRGYIPLVMESNSDKKSLERYLRRQHRTVHNQERKSSKPPKEPPDWSRPPPAELQEDQNNTEPNTPIQVIDNYGTVSKKRKFPTHNLTESDSEQSKRKHSKIHGQCWECILDADRISQEIKKSTSSKRRKKTSVPLPPPKKRLRRLTRLPDPESDDSDSDINLRKKIIRCTQCYTCYHPTCVEISSEVMKVVQTYAWKCPLCKMCDICNISGDDDKIILCDGCDRGYHTFCLRPPLKELPEGDWLCDTCLNLIAKSKKENLKKKKTNNDKHGKKEKEDKNEEKRKTNLRWNQGLRRRLTQSPLLPCGVAGGPEGDLEK